MILSSPTVVLLTYDCLGFYGIHAFVVLRAEDLFKKYENN